MEDMIEVRIFKNGKEQQDSSFVEPGTVQECEEDLNREHRQQGTLKLGPLTLRATRKLQPGTVYSYHVQQTGAAHDPRVDALVADIAQLKLQQRKEPKITPSCTVGYAAYYEEVVKANLLKLITPRSSRLPTPPAGFSVPEAWIDPPTRGSEQDVFCPLFCRGIEEFGGTRRLIDRGEKRKPALVFDLQNSHQIFDTQRRYWLDALAPDFCLGTSSCALGRMDLEAIGIIEIQAPSPDLDNEHRGKTMAYLSKLLEAQPWRSHSEGFLTDLHNLEYYTCDREGEQFVFQYKVMRLATPEHAAFFLSRLFGAASDWGFLNFNLTLGSVVLVPSEQVGATQRSKVFAAQHDNNEVIIKITYLDFSDGYTAANRELHSLQDVQKQGGHVCLPSLLFSQVTEFNERDVRIFVTAPRVYTMTGLDISIIRDHIDGLEVLHKSGWAHLDLEQKHLGVGWIDGEQRGCIIDYSCSEPLHKTVSISCTSGTLKCAAKEQLLESARSQTITPSELFDLEAYVKSLMLIASCRMDADLNIIYTQDNRRSSVAKFWDEREATLPPGNVWLRALEASRVRGFDGKPQYGKLKSILSEVCL